MKEYQIEINYPLVSISGKNFMFVYNHSEDVSDLLFNGDNLKEKINLKIKLLKLSLSLLNVLDI